MNNCIAAHTVRTAVISLLLLGVQRAQAEVDLLFDPPMQTIVLNVNDVVEIDLVAHSDDGTEQLITALDAILSWDTPYLELLGVDTGNAGYAWFVAGFLNDPDNINDGISDPPIGVPANDGTALYTALAQPGNPAAAGPDDLIVTTLRFRALQPTSGTTVSFLPSLGQFGLTRVFGEGLQNDVTGEISATAVVEIVCDDGNVCTDDSWNAEDGCVFTPNSASCDDGNACTENDQCSGGTCVGGGAPDCDDGNACTDDSCDEIDGCQNDNNTASCDDGNICTENDQCAGGACVGGPPPDCGDGNPCTDDSCDDIDGCQHDNNTAPCDDDDACTENDQCADGTCVGGDAPDCNDGNLCTDDSCDEIDGCQNDNNTALCDDGNACTENDQCAGGACVGGAPLDCDDLDPCTDDSCDEVDGCQHDNNTAPCDDGDPCTSADGEEGGDDVCDGNGSCVGVPIVCNDGNECTADQCVGGFCQFDDLPNGSPCDDGEACTSADGVEGGSDLCNGAGACLGTPVDCANLEDDCNIGVCFPDSGSCAAKPRPEGTPCDDDDACTSADGSAGDDACDGAGSCEGQPINCDDDNVCTDDACDETEGCQNTNNVASCDDDNACTENDQCADGVCVSGDPPDCDDGNPCTDDSCDEIDGCQHVNNTAPCNDDQACTENDVCAAGVCGGSAVDCSGVSNQCAPSCGDGVCSGNGEDCSTCLADCRCGGGEDCPACCGDGVCAGPGENADSCPVDCGDPPPLPSCCNEASCDPDGADGNCDILTPLRDDTPCDDGDVCTETDQCAAGECVGSAEPDCDDGVDCTIDSCDPELGCLNIPDDDFCADPDVCSSDVCDPELGCLHLTTCPPDINNDLATGAFDLAVLLGCWGIVTPGICECLDADDDGDIDAFDLAVLLGEWGTCDGAVGACCDADGVGGCEQLTPGGCYVAEGYFLGYDTDCLDCPDEACSPDAGDCCSANGSAGCSNAVCCNAVCDADPSCCSVDWSSDCADLAEVLCVMCFPPPANDDCGDALAIFDGLTDFETVAATTDGLAHPGCQFDGQTYNDIWYNYGATCTGTLTVTTCEDLGGSALYDTDLVVYDGCGCPAADEDVLGCNDDDLGNPCGGKPNYQSTVIVPVVDEACYKIRVGGFSAGSFGSGTVLITCDE